MNHYRSTSAFALASATAALSMLGLAIPAGAEPGRPQHINDRIAELCAASDVDLQGKRLARQCRAEVRATWQQEQRSAARKARAERARLALGR